MALKQLDHLAYAFCTGTIRTLAQNSDQKFGYMIAVLVCFIPVLVSLLFHVTPLIQKPLQSVDTLVDWGSAQADALQ